MLTRILHKFGKMLKSKKGYTLVEVAAVVAITGTLAAVAVPVAKDQVNSGKKAAAVQDVQAIAGAINQLRGDTGVAPVFLTVGARTATPAATPDITLLSSKKGTMPDGALTGTDWGGAAAEVVLPVSAVDAVSGVSIVGGRTTLSVILGSDFFENHLVQNGSGSNVIHDEKTWNGPYFTADKADPWGHKYLCNIGELFLWDQDNDVPTHAVFVISAGPDGIIQTPTTQLLSAFVVNGDDIVSRVQ